MATLEEAQRCPKCKQPGSESGTRPGPRHSTIHVMTCLNENCTWYETGWVIQEQADGSIYERQGKQEKQFPVYTPGQEAVGRRILEDAVGRDLRDLHKEQ